MYIPFEMLPKNSRVWVYQSPTSIKEKILYPFFQSFCEEWTAHGNPLKCSFTCKDSYFLILGVDESFYSVSGCSIDASVHFLQKIETTYKESFLKRDFIFIEKENTLHLLQNKNIKESIKNEYLKKDTYIINTAVSTIEQCETKWKLTAENTWISKYF